MTQFWYPMGSYTGLHYRHSIILLYRHSLHIFPKAQVASNKNAHKLRHHCWAQFIMLFHMMWSILFRELALKTLKWKFLIGCWRTSTKEKVVSRPNITLQTNWMTPCERAWKTVPQNGVASCVHFCLRSLVRFERCAICEINLNMKWPILLSHAIINLKGFPLRASYALQLN